MRAFLLCFAIVVVGCGDDDGAGDTSADASRDVSSDVSSDVSRDANADVSVDVGTDVDVPDSAPADTSDPGPLPTDGFRCESVSGDVPDGVFSLMSFGGHLYAGAFGYGREAESMLYAYPDWRRVEPGLRGIGESVCALLPFGDYLYANTENDGDIFRSRDGANWERVYDGPDGVIGCSLAEFRGQLYAVHYNYDTSSRGQVLRMVGDTFEVVFDSGVSALYLRELAVVGDELFAFGVQEGRGQMLRTSDGRSFAQAATAHRFFRADTIGGRLFVGSAAFFADGDTAIFTFDGARFDRVQDVPSTHVTGFAEQGGYIFASTSSGWKDETGPTRLLVSGDGGESFVTACTLPETALWDVEVHDGVVYTASWDYRNRGRLYRVARSDEPPAADPCGPIAATSGYELCERGPDRCAGVFVNGDGCVAFCAAAGLRCTGHFGGEPGCMKEADSAFTCGTETGHMSDWCECGR